MINIPKITDKAAEAARCISRLDSDAKNAILHQMANAIEEKSQLILAVNEKEVQEARQDALPEAMIDRLTLNPQRIANMVEGIRTITQLKDPVGAVRELGKQESGIEVSKVRVPLGVICMIYEARPNVAADASALCFKSGNAVILRCGKEAIQTSMMIVTIMREVLIKNGLPQAALTMITDPDRNIMTQLLKQDEHIDLVIPRGGEGLIRFVSENSRIPVIQHYKGVCHLFVDESADMQVAKELLLNGKVQRPGVCNALECLLVHKDMAQEFLPIVALHCRNHGVKVNACAQSMPYFETAKLLESENFGQEYLSLELAVRIVDDLDHAVAHIDRFGSKHTEVICTRNTDNAKRFQRIVDASVVMVNASSRFSDGGELGLGAEIGIATTKLHAYGPMGLESLTTEKYLVNGTGQIRL
ncbi:glutamate-5-semialdehyde dehydrogenase [Paraneptunicella aestuarii]|uniref:glutamate-5-semialdehyde dehydrogenase n=1 Tax=Paraneptunicella aestuarii TaxID=2831148 RepID=UPI001E56DEC2|nr:glutamate-5-semialdehyde dehydrogenase [Paraneptunicella aestuarii]UAA40384.1 glutamate-5-semialdehyde dehydrogenase [Paraneptunicella aestuarii]